MIDWNIQTLFALPEKRKKVPESVTGHAIFCTQRLSAVGK